MKSKNMKQKRAINNESQKKHRKEFWLQILLPIVGFVLILAILWIIFSFTNSGTYRSWSSLSFIFLSGFLLLISIIAFVALLFITISLGKLLKLLPEKTFIAQEWLKTVNNTVEDILNKIVSPLISSQSWLSLLNLNNIFKKDESKNE